MSVRWKQYGVATSRDSERFQRHWAGDGLEASECWMLSFAGAVGSSQVETHNKALERKPITLAVYNGDWSVRLSPLSWLTQRIAQLAR